MAEQDWLRPEVPAELQRVPHTAAPAPGTPFALRPLSLGELLDRTFTLYRSRFALFAGITLLAAAVRVVMQGLSMSMVQQVGTFAAHTGSVGPLPHLRLVGPSVLATYAALLVYYLVSAVTQAGTALAVIRVYLHRPATVRASLGEILPRWYRWIGIALWQAGSLVWIPLLLGVPAAVLLAFGGRTGSRGLIVIGAVLAMLAGVGGIPLGVIAYLRNALAIPAAVMEGLAIRPAMRRSKALASGAKGRVFVLLLIAGGLLEVVGILETPLSFLVMTRPEQSHMIARAIALVITFVGHTVVAPVLLIGLTLVYFDQRVRREAFDLELLLEAARPGSADPGVPAAAAEPEGYAPRP